MKYWKPSKKEVGYIFIKQIRSAVLFTLLYECDSFLTKRYRSTVFFLPDFTASVCRRKGASSH